MQKTRIAWAGFMAFTALSMTSAWLNIQAVRWGYKNQRLLGRWDDLKKSEQGLDRRLHESFSLERLNRVARERFHLKVPSPEQVELIRENGEATG